MISSIQDALTVWVFIYGLQYIWVGILMNRVTLKPSVTWKYFDRGLMFAVGVPMCLNGIYFHNWVVYLVLGIFESFGCMASWFCLLIWKFPGNTIEKPVMAAQVNMALLDLVCAFCCFALIW